MNQLDKEYEELKAFIGLEADEKMECLESENAKQYKENKELKHFISEVKSLVTYIHADYWSDPQVERLHEKLKDFN